MSYKVETLSKNATTTIGEAPHWDELTQTLLFVDLLAGNVHRYNTFNKIEEKRHIGEHVSLVVPRKCGGYVVGTGVNISHLDWVSGNLTTLATVEVPEGGKFNDGKCDASGRLWAGTVGPKLSPTVFKPESAFLYSLDTKQNIKQHLDKITISNGMTWTNNNTKMYYIDSTPRIIYSFDYNLTDGTLANKQELIKFPQENFKTLGNPDGMTSDVDGKIWCAFFGGSCVIRFDQETGQEISRIDLPTSLITSCCWGGKNFDELYVTSAKRGLTDELAGSVFRVTGLGTSGTRAETYWG
ncbi:regucalcin isoform X1 [Patella vulgata]|uniref:regucalcin isoform X1 n=1 Tax=Patella vulgata TaxID=6465 RepID=UPI00217FF966|nr:regucalcin isoform X1 [Patella vulgata]